MRKGKTVILVGKSENFLDLGCEMDFIIGIVSRNLATTSNFVEFRDSQNFTFFEAPRVTSDTRHSFGGLTLSHVSNGEQVKHKSKWDPCMTSVTT